MKLGHSLRDRPIHRARWRALTLVTGLLVFVAAGEWAGAERTTIGTATGVPLGRLTPGVRRSDLNVLVITLDTTRADRLAAYGFTGVKTPNLDRLAQEGVRFDQTAAAAPLTFPAHCSLFTGRLPPQHGARDNGVVLSSREATLAAVLKAHGFQTAAVTGSYVVDSRWGLNQGFDQYDDDLADAPGANHVGRGLQRAADAVADRALEWLYQHDGARFFAWLHFYDPHAPYEPPEPYRTIYATDPYLGEIAFVDTQLGRVLAFLDERRILDRTIVVVIGDHGESLGEHGERTHGLFVYESVLRVPFIIRAPFSLVGGRHVAEPTRSIDMMPTVLDLLGLPAPAGVQGRSVAGLMTGTGRALDLATYSESLYPRDRFGWSDLHASRDGRFKVIRAPRPELYDLAADPHELRNLYAERPALAEGMAARLRAFERGLLNDSQSQTAGPGLPRPSVSLADPDARARLAALGYTAAVRAMAVEDGSALPDPKDQIGLYNLITEGRVLPNARGSSARSIRVR